VDEPPDNLRAATASRHPKLGDWARLNRPFTFGRPCEFRK